MCHEMIGMLEEIRSDATSRLGGPDSRGEAGTMMRIAEVADEAIEEMEFYTAGVSLYDRWVGGSLPPLPEGRFCFSFGKRKFYYLRARPRSRERRFSLGGAGCRYLCGQNLRRPHFTCMSGGCRLKNVWYGRAPPVFEVEDFSMYFVKERRSRLKGFLRKILITLMEFASTG